MHGDFCFKHSLMTGDGEIGRHTGIGPANPNEKWDQVQVRILLPQPRLKASGSSREIKVKGDQS